MSTSSRLVLAGIAFGAALPVLAQQLQVVVPATIAPGAPVAQSLSQCNPEKMMGDHAVRALSQKYSGTVGVARAQPGARTVTLTLMSVQGAGGGAWSGAKSMSVRAEVLEDGKPVAGQTFTRNSGGGVLGGVSGSCPIVERIAKALAQDITVWMAAVPAAGAGGEKLLVQVPARIDPGVQLSAPIKQDCAVETKFGVNVFERVGGLRRPGAILQVENPDAAGADKVLRLTILKFDVQGVNAPLDAPQPVALRAEVLQGGKVLATNVFERNATASRGANTYTTCQLVERVAIHVGQDVARWLKKDVGAAVDLGPDHEN